MQSRLGTNQVRGSSVVAICFQPQPRLGVASQEGAVAALKGRSARHARQTPPLQLGFVNAATYRFHCYYNAKSKIRTTAKQIILIIATCTILDTTDLRVLFSVC